MMEDLTTHIHTVAKPEFWERSTGNTNTHKNKLNISHKTKINNCYVTSNLVVLNETSYFENNA